MNMADLSCINIIVSLPSLTPSTPSQTRRLRASQGWVLLLSVWETLSSVTGMCKISTVTLPCPTLLFSTLLFSSLLSCSFLFYSFLTSFLHFFPLLFTSVLFCSLLLCSLLLSSPLLSSLLFFTYSISIY